MHTTYPAGLMWFRRDLRTSDNAALSRCLQACAQVHCVFVLDTEILDALPRRDRRVAFIRESVVELDAALRALAGHPEAGLIVLHGPARELVPRLAVQLGVQTVVAAHDDEPGPARRDAQVRDALAAAGIAFETVKDHVIFERRELLTGARSPYTVFTPYKKAWLAKLDAAALAPHAVEPHAAALARRPPGHRRPLPTLAQLGFAPCELPEFVRCGASGAQAMLEDFLARMDAYGDTRDFPAVEGPSHLGVHLRFGTASIRALVALAHARAQAGSEGAAVWLSELVWRDFYMQVMANFDVADEQGDGRNFRREYDRVQWESGAPAQALFAAWCEGRTGYPIIDAAMAQLNDTGYMHNRLRMVTASFLTKDLGLDWRWGERYFAEKLNDYELASNNGGWQWAASTGTDAQPYFRIFNPVSQGRRFDAQGEFIKRYLPQLAKLPAKLVHAPWEAKVEELDDAGVELGVTYPRPIVDHGAARAATLQRFAAVRGGAG